jgi:hypothetical protein
MSRYTSSELKTILGERWQDFQNWRKDPSSFGVQKKIIANFEDFDEETKCIYLQISSLIKDSNKEQDVKIWAFGSRINGTWRTREESEEIAEKYKVELKYSDFDIATDAEFIPEISIGQKVDVVKIPKGLKTNFNGVLIPLSR